MTRSALWLVPLITLLQAHSETLVRGRWILASKGGPADYSCDARQFGIQPSGLAWSEGRLWGVSDQSSSCPGCLFAVSPLSGGEDALLLEEDGLPLVYQGKRLAIDAEGIAVLKTTEEEMVFALVVEDRSEAIAMAFGDRNPGAAVVVRLQRESRAALVSEIWEFEVREEDAVRPYNGDKNRGFEGIAFDHRVNRGYLAYEQAQDGRPRLFTFEIPKSSGSSERISVAIEPVAFELDFDPRGKPETELNFNGLALHHREGQSTRLLVLCRNRELLLVLTLPDATSAVLDEQVTLRFRSPIGQTIEWVSPEGIAIDEDTNRLYVVSDPDPSCEGNWRPLPPAGSDTGLDAARRAAESNLFAQFVPLLFALDLTVALR